MINIEALIGRAYAAAYPWAHKFLMDRRLPDVGVLDVRWHDWEDVQENDPVFDTVPSADADRQDR